MKAQATTQKNSEQLQEKWYLVDAAGLVVGRLATRVAQLLRGKTTPDYSPHLDPKVHVVITNADKVVFTGAKWADKTYYHHSGWRTGIKSITAEKLLDKKPEDILAKAIHGMLPKNRLGRKLNKHLRIYRSGEYNGQHDAQKPEPLTIRTRVPKKND
jgi:large subunit ribosomal protein L13